MGKIKSFIEKLKKNMFMYLVVWLCIAILLVAPITYTITNANIEGVHWLEAITINIVDNILKLPITVIFEDMYIYDFLEGIKYYSILYFGLVVIAINKSLPKGNFHDIEHGSSDWCLPGEQYRILSKKNGLLLAKDNYLPIDKTGNINVLIVGRFRFW